LEDAEDDEGDSWFSLESDPKGNAPSSSRVGVGVTAEIDVASIGSVDG
jgi:hypothetical protein